MRRHNSLLLLNKKASAPLPNGKSGWLPYQLHGYAPQPLCKPILTVAKVKNQQTESYGCNHGNRRYETENCNFLGSLVHTPFHAHR
jgi:hypothetical protein